MEEFADCNNLVDYRYIPNKQYVFYRLNRHFSRLQMQNSI